MVVVAVVAAAEQAALLRAEMDLTEQPGQTARLDHRALAVRAVGQAQTHQAQATRKVGMAEAVDMARRVTTVCRSRSKTTRKRQHRFAGGLYQARRLLCRPANHHPVRQPQTSDFSADPDRPSRTIKSDRCF